MAENNFITWNARFASHEEMANRTPEQKEESDRKVDLLEKYIYILIKHYPGSTHTSFGPDTMHCLENMDDAINLLRTAGFSRDEAEIQFIDSVNDYRLSENKSDVQSLGPEV